VSLDNASRTLLPPQGPQVMLSLNIGYSSFGRTLPCHLVLIAQEWGKTLFW
jgi:hypothetical protein